LIPIKVETLSQALVKIRHKKPVIHTMTNWVTAGEVANALHAIGARPIMSISKNEVTEIVANADGLVINFGTPDPLRIEAMLLAGRQANRLGRPVILDPVGAGTSQFRTEAIRTILSQIRISIIRGNQAEIGILSERGGKLRGIDADQGPSDLYGAAKILSQKTGSVVAISGQEDWVVKDESKVVIGNGHPLMSQVVGTGCMLSAIMGAFAAVEQDPFMAAIGACVLFGLAGERASIGGKGPGTFKAALLDALFTLKPEEIEAGAKLR
jgi:hydroxyethylthiazole kinase